MNGDLRSWLDSIDYRMATELMSVRLAVRRQVGIPPYYKEAPLSLFPDARGVEIANMIRNSIKDTDSVP